MTYRMLKTVLAGLQALAVCGSSALAGEARSPRLYEMTTETGMPHLEVNLRYATVTEKRCLNTEDLSGAFWMLKDVSLQDCRLVKAGETVDESAYEFQCHGGHGTTGNATWQLGPTDIAGTLNVRLGGKNMTFFQRITAKAIGACG